MSSSRPVAAACGTNPGASRWLGGPPGPPNTFRSQKAAQLPQLGIEPQLDPRAQVGAAGAATRSGLGADLTLGHQYVPGPPQRPRLVVLDKGLGQIPQRAVAFPVVRDRLVRG